MKKGTFSRTFIVTFFVFVSFLFSSAFGGNVKGDSEGDLTQAALVGVQRMPDRQLDFIGRVARDWENPRFDEPGRHCFPQGGAAVEHGCHCPMGYTGRSINLNHF